MVHKCEDKQRVIRRPGDQDGGAGVPIAGEIRKRDEPRVVDPDSLADANFAHAAADALHVHHQ